MYLKRTEYFDKEGKLQGNKYKLNWGAGPNLGATRPRVGIWGIEPQVGNADAGTRRPQIRTRPPIRLTNCSFSF